MTELAFTPAREGLTMRRTDGRGATVTRAARMLVGLSLFAVPACTQAPPPRVRPAVVRLAAARDRADSVTLVLTRLRPSSTPAD